MDVSMIDSVITQKNKLLLDAAESIAARMFETNEALHLILEGMESEGYNPDGDEVTASVFSARFPQFMAALNVIHRDFQHQNYQLDEAISEQRNKIKSH